MTEPAFEAIPATGASNLLLICDHAANALPPAYGALGLSPPLFETHIAYDIGAATVTRVLAADYGAAAVLGRWSRLLIDLNRGADDPTLVMKLSDGSIIPGNRAVDPAEVAQRITDFHRPYHDAITREIDRLLQRGDDRSPPRVRSTLAGEMPVAGLRPETKGPADLLSAERASEGQRGPTILSFHSFTPAWKSAPRPWDVGVLWDKDGRLAQPLMARLEKAGFAVGDNEPYSGALDGDTLNIHGTRRGLPHVLIEMRQDLIADDGKARAFAARLKPVLDAALADMEQ